MNVKFHGVVAAALLALLPGYPSHAEEAAPDAAQKDTSQKTVAESAKELGQAIGRDAKAVGQSVERDAKAVGKAVGEGAKEVGCAAKHGAKKVKDAVTTK
jgi:hypothetical protein